MIFDMTLRYNFLKTIVVLTTLSIIIPINEGYVYAHHKAEGPEAQGFPHQCLQGTPGPDSLTGQCIQGKHGNDNLRCDNNTHCHLYGDSNDDTITGGEGYDYLHGDDMPHFPQNAGNDVIYGKGGDDVIFGDAGDDVLYGGPGADWFHCGSGIDKVMDFNEQEGDEIIDEQCEQINHANPISTTDCPPGTTFNPMTGTCAPVAGSGCPPGTFNPMTGAACPTPGSGCPPGTFNPMTGAACPTLGSTPGSGCPSGTTFNPMTGTCAPVAGSGCPPGTTFNPMTGTCAPVAGSGCPPGTTFNPMTGTCTFVTPPNPTGSGCPFGTIRDPLTGACPLL